MANLNQEISDQPNYRKYFQALFGPELVDVELWVLKHPDNGGSVLKLVYGLISPSKQISGGSWRKSDFIGVYSSKKIEEQTENPKLAKLSITLPGNTAITVMQEFCDGKSLGDATHSSGLAAIPVDFSGLKLVIESTFEKEFAFRKPVIGVPENVVKTLSPYYQGISSPMRDTVSVVATLFRLDKALLWKTRSGAILQNTKELLNGLIGELTSKTGLAFQGTDSKRLGNLEWVVYPSKTKEENPLCKVSIDKYVADEKTKRELSIDEQKKTLAQTIVYRSINVEVLAEAFAESVELIVECAAYNGNDLISNQVLMGSMPATRQYVFPLSEQVSGGEVKVFKKEPSESIWSLWYLEHFDLFRSFSISSKFTHAEIPKSEWFDTLMNVGLAGAAAGHSARPALFSKFNNAVNHFFRFDPWNPIGERMGDLVRKINPPVSAADFFLPKGRGVDVERTADISEWLSKTCERHSATTCLIFDPYFGTLGVDVLLKTKIRDMELVAITNCQCGSNDVYENQDKKSWWERLGYTLKKSPLLSKVFPKKKNWTPKRATEIQNYCNSNLSNFVGRGVRIYDLRSKPVNTDQLFHDRYVLFFDKNGQLEAGYNLSNSIQGAMVTYPLLVTPVPEDVLGALQDYIVNFLKLNSKSDSRELVLLHSSHPEPFQRANAMARKWSQVVSNPSALFSVLAPGRINSAMDIFGIESTLRDSGILIGDDSFDLSVPEVNVNSILDKASSLNFQDFLEFWKDFSEILCRSRDSDRFCSLLALNPNFQKHIKDLLVENRFTGPVPSSADSDLGILDEYISKIKASTDFGIALFNARQLSVYGMRGVFLRANFVVLQTMRAAIAMDEGLLVEALDKIVEKASRSKMDTFLFGKIVEDLAQMLALRPSDKLVGKMADARALFLKALVCPALFNNYPSDDLLKAFDSIASGKYSDTEKMMIYSEWIHELRGRASRKGGNEPAEDKALKVACVSRLVSLFPASNRAMLADLMKRVDGPIWGTWALLNYQEIGLELLGAQKISLRDLASVWVDPCKRRSKSVTV